MIWLFFLPGLFWDTCNHCVERKGGLYNSEVDEEGGFHW